MQYKTTHDITGFIENDQCLWMGRSTFYVCIQTHHTHRHWSKHD